jgi:hypothetical protein
MPEAIRCTTCGQIWVALDLAPIYDYWGRVHPGSVVPLGQCPSPTCQALCYPPYSYVHDLEQQHAALQDVVSRLLDWAAMMGGWEAPVWAQARHVLARSRGQVPVTDHDAEALPNEDDDAT